MLCCHTGSLFYHMRTCNTRRPMSPRQCTEKLTEAGHGRPRRVHRRSWPPPPRRPKRGDNSAPRPQLVPAVATGAAGRPQLAPTGDIMGDDGRHPGGQNVAATRPRLVLAVAAGAADGPEVAVAVAMIGEAHPGRHPVGQNVRTAPGLRRRPRPSAVNCQDGPHPVRVADSQAAAHRHWQERGRPRHASA